MFIAGRQFTIFLRSVRSEMLTSNHIALLTEPTEIRDVTLYKHYPLAGLIQLSIQHYSMNLKTYLSSNAMSNFLSRVRYSSLNDR